MRTSKIESSVLTINVPFTEPWGLPYGPAVVNGVLKSAGYDVQIWDLSIDLYTQFSKCADFDSFANANSIGGYVQSSVSKSFAKDVTKWIKKEFKNKIADRCPEIILLSVFSSQSLDFVVPLVSIIRDIMPDVYILIGGRGLDNVERQTKMSYGEFYATYLTVNTYLGDAENCLVNTIKTRYQGCFVALPVNSEELENVPAADWSGVNFDLYTGDLWVPITASKGCVRECTFCDVAGGWPKYVYRKGEKVGREIIDLYNKTGMTKFEFMDNLINGSISNFRSMNTVIANEIPNILEYKGYAICRPKKEFLESDFELAKIAGASLLRVGIESGSEKVRYDMKKKFSNEDIDWFATNCAKYNIKQEWLMFTGYPTETEEDFQDTLKLLEKYSYLGKQGYITVFISLPMMLTTNSNFMREYAHSYGLEHNRNDSWSDFFWSSTNYPDNTFEIRVDRWRRFAEKIKECGYPAPSPRQLEKFLELDGLEKIYQDYKNAKTQKNFIPITNIDIYINKNTHI